MLHKKFAVVGCIMQKQDLSYKKIEMAITVVPQIMNLRLCLECNQKCQSNRENNSILILAKIYEMCPYFYLKQDE